MQLRQEPLDATAVNLLLYLEQRLVEHRGLVRSDLMQPEEMVLAQRWNESGFLGFAPLAEQELDYRRGNPPTHRVSFSDEAWVLAAHARRARAP